MKWMGWPVLIGSGREKCTILEKDMEQGQYGIVIATLKKDPGEAFEKTGRIPVECVGHGLVNMRFCSLKAAERFLNTVQKMVDMWRADEAVNEIIAGRN